MSLKNVLAEIQNCKCKHELPHGFRPILQVSTSARLCIASQAPGIRAHETGIPFNDRSGDRLREWMGMDRKTFYGRNVAIVPMDFCFPGHLPNGADKPPRSKCALAWRDRLLAELPHIELTLLVGSYAQAWHLGDNAKSNLTETVRAWREYTPRYLPLAHPSWHNNAWLAANPWFEREILPYLKRRVREICHSSIILIPQTRSSGRPPRLPRL
ncbi:MAG: uracil-DNA glycosylase family protein [Alphaproteobacteria bacterium]|nr:uracil-DNA glycosylase family protein [Alphaproteobacteria bacterium]MDE2494677.1 uracil-DNA glycosylase family protein [Alphaproteobacteria bacterium]